MESDTNFIISFLEGMNATRWGLIGLGLVGLELVTGSTYILWPAAAALIMAAWVFFLPLSWELQFILFFALSLILLVVGHYFVRPFMKGGEPSDTNEPGKAMLGRRVLAFSDFVNGEGRVSVGDTQWKARAGGVDPKTGDNLVITDITGTTLIVEPVTEI